MSSKSKVERYPFDSAFERVVVWTCCCDPDFHSRIGRYIEIDALSTAGVDEARFIKRAPGRLAMQAVAAIAARRGQGPASSMEVLQELAQQHALGQVTREECNAVRLMLDEVERDPKRPNKAAIFDLLTPAVKARLHQEALIKGMHEWSAREGLDPLKRRIAEIDAIGATTTTATPEIEIDVVGDFEPERIEWLSPGRIAYGKLTNIIGDPGIGKSLICCEAARAVTRGESLHGGKARKPAAVMMLSDEDGIADTLLPRLLSTGADVDMVLRPRIKKHGDLRLPELNPAEIKALERVIVEREVGLVVLDPLADLIPDKIDADAQRAVRRVMGLVRELAERTSAAVVSIIHLNKNNQSGNALHRSIGSIAFSAIARSVLLVAREPDSDRRVLALAKCTNAAPAKSLLFDIVPAYIGVGTNQIETQRIVWAGESDLTADSLVAPPEDKDRKSALATAMDFLRGALAGGPRLAKEVEDEALKGMSISAHTLRRARERLRVVAKQQLGAKSVWEWSLPTEPVSPEKKGDAER